MKNKNKKAKIIVIIISLLVIIGIFALLAYFTDTAFVTNHLKLGIVDIELEEFTIDKYGNKIKWKDADYIIPGDTISKIPEISCVKGSADCYIRAKVYIKCKDVNLMERENIITLNNLDVDSSKWYYCKSDGYFYYKEILTENSEPAILFTKIDVPYEYDNDWALEEFEVKVTAEAIQTKNFTPDFSENSTNPWPDISESDIEECSYPDHIK